MSKIEMTLFYTDDFGNRHGPFVKYEEPKITPHDYQVGYALAMRYNGSLKIPVGVGRTIIECELASSFKRPLYVSARREMIAQFENTAKRMGVVIQTCHIIHFKDTFDSLNPDCVIACESISQSKNFAETVRNCGVPTWMNRSV